MTTVRIPPVLRAHAGDAKQADAAGATVGEVINDLVRLHPGLRDQLLGPEGTLNRFVNVYLNGQDIRYLGELDTPVHDNDTLILLPAMAGGTG